MILTTEDRPIWRLCYRDFDDAPGADGKHPRCVVYTDYLEITDTLVIMGRSMTHMGVQGGEVQYSCDGPERTVVSRDAFLWADCYDDDYARLWVKEGMDNDQHA